MTDFRQWMLSLTMKISVVMSQFLYGKNVSMRCLQNSMPDKYHRHKGKFKFLFQEYFFYIMKIS